MSIDTKTLAARHALAFVQPGMVVGLGSGSTAAAFVTALGEQAALRESVAAVCTSAATQALAERLGFRLRDVNAVTRIDVTVDGADEITPQLDMIKGGGGALFRERIVALLSDFHVTIADAAKLKNALGGLPLPVEIVPFAHAVTTRWVLDALRDVGVVVERWTLRAAKGAPAPSGAKTSEPGAPFRTDNGNLIVDVKLAAIPDPARVAAALDGIDGVVTHGLFLGLTHLLVCADADGVVREVRRA